MTPTADTATTGANDVPGRTSVEITRRVSISQVDHRQIFYGTYLLWMAEGYEELLHALGHPLERHVDEGVETPVVAVDCRYLSPTRLGDEVKIESSVARIGRTSFQVEHRLRLGDRAVALGTVTKVCVDTHTQRPVPVPLWLRQAASTDAESTAGRPSNNP
jgi:YbgC/YbaW family acyl-CoA thioester hydrolase